MGSFSGKKLLLLGFIVVLLAAIPATVFVLQQQQDTQSQASAATVITFNPKAGSVEVGKPVTLTILMDPQTNFVSFTKLVLTYDPEKLTPATTGTTCGSAFCPDTTAFAQTLEGPKYDTGKISITLSPGPSAANALQGGVRKIAEVTFIGKAAGTSKIDFDKGPNATYVFSAKNDKIDPANPDLQSENVLSSAEPATITITDGTGPTATPTGAIPSPSVSPTAAPTTAQPSPTGTQSASTSTTPVCTNMLVDRTTSGTAPFTLTFTVTGNDTGGSINKVTFSFGDGSVEDVTTSGGIGTSSVNTQKAHTFQNAGTYTATAILTDNTNLTSSQGSCQQTITVVAAAQSGGSGGTGGGGTSGGGSGTDNTPKPTLAATGPGSSFVNIGLIGGVLTVLGAAVFFLL